MLSNHYSFVYDAPNNWLVLVLMMLAGALIRQFFVLKHKGAWKWQYWIVGGGLILVVAVALAPKPQPVLASNKPVTFAQVQHIVQERCLLCHAGAAASKGVRLDSAPDIVSHAQAIYQQVVVLKAMPLNNATQMTDLERAEIGQWIKDGAKP
jgi:uncharacterized membrane protein